MRTAFINELIAQARLHPRLFLMVGDLGFSVVEPFAAEFPDRFLNIGVAEQNMTGVAAGLASEGYHVFTYSIANFPTLRCLEQIRNDVCYHQLPVTVVSVGAGLAYGNLGYSHHAVQDIACLRSLPGITVLSPADPGEARQCVRNLAGSPRPSYLRIGKAGEPVLHAEAPVSAEPLRVSGAADDSVAIVACGAILKEAINTAALLRAEGVAAAVYSLPWLAPVRASDLSALHGHRLAAVLEEHVQAGGAGEMLALLLPRSMEVRSFCVDRNQPSGTGSQEYLRRMHGISAEQVAAALRAAGAEPDNFRPGSSAPA